MRIFLIGYMGSGKSMMAPELAKALRLHAHDLDKIIEAEAWMSIKDVFKKKGETFFRQLERDALGNYIRHHDDFVMATGGGTPCFFENMDLMNEAGITIYIKVEPLELYRRLKEQKGERPMIAKLGEAALWSRILQHLEQRRITYEGAQIIWDGHRRDLRPLIDQLKALRTQAK
jgi:shikimate kinase